MIIDVNEETFIEDVLEQSEELPVIDMAHYAAVNEAYGSYFGDLPPAREAYAVKGLPRGVNVEISGIAVKD